MLKFRYIIMCGGDYVQWQKPRQLTEINGEPIIARTIRLLRENGVSDIAISTNNPAFEGLGVSLIHHDNPFVVYKREGIPGGTWVTGFYPTNEPTCYILGDVVFSPEAINTIVNYPTDSIDFFASAPPFDPRYPKPYAEPFAFKVANQKKFRKCIDRLKVLEQRNLFERPPIAWELWQVIKGTPLNELRYDNYVVINDYTCDLDWPSEAAMFENYVCN